MSGKQKHHIIMKYYDPLTTEMETPLCGTPREKAQKVQVLGNLFGYLDGFYIPDSYEGQETRIDFCEECVTVVKNSVLRTLEENK